MIQTSHSLLRGASNPDPITHTERERLVSAARTPAGSDLLS